MARVPTMGDSGLCIPSLLPAIFDARRSSKKSMQNRPAIKGCSLECTCLHVALLGRCWAASCVV